MLASDMAVPLDVLPTVAPKVISNHAGKQTLLFRLRYSRWSVGLLVSLCIFVDMVVYGVAIPLLPVVVKERLNMNPVYSGFLFGAYAIGLLVFTPVFGIVSDKYGDRKYTMLVSLFGLAVSSVGFAFSQRYWHFVLVRILQGMTAAGNWTVGLSLANDVFPADKLGSVMGVVLAAMNLGYMVGTGAGGMLYDWRGFEAPVFFGGVLALIAFCARLFVDERFVLLHPRNDPTSAEIRPLATPIFKLVTYRPVWVNSLVVMTVATVNSGLELCLPLHFYGNFNTSATVVGLVILGIAIPGLIVSPCAGYLCDRYSVRKIQLGSLCAFMVVTQLAGIPQTLSLAIAALVLFGIVFAVVLVPPLIDMGIFVQNNFPHSGSQIYSFFSLAYALAMFVGPTVSSLLYENIGFLWSMSVSTGIVLLVTILYAWFYRVESRMKAPVMSWSTVSQPPPYQPPIR